MEESIRFERMDAINATEVQAQFIKPLWQLSKNKTRILLDHSFFPSKARRIWTVFLIISHELFNHLILFAVTSL